MKKNRLIPFKYTPAAWGLSGEAYEIAEICYNYDDIEAKLKIADVRYKHNEYEHERETATILFNANKIDNYEYQSRIIHNDMKFNKISVYEGKSKLLILEKDHGKNPAYDYELALLKHEHNVITETEYKLELAALELKDGKITELEYEKRVAMINDVSWVKVIGLDTDKDNPGNGSLELDWNPKFVAELKEHGYEGATEEQIVDQWLSELCKTIAAQKFAGTGYFDEVMNVNSMDDNVTHHQFIKSRTRDNKREVK